MEDAQECMIRTWLRGRASEKGKKEFYAMLRRNHLPYRRWNKKAKWLFEEVVKGEARVQETPHGVVRISRNLWVIVSHMTLSGEVVYRYEKYRQWPNGKKQTRKRWLKIGDDYYPVAISESSREGEDSNELALRALGEDEEGGFVTPCLTRLSELPMRHLTFHDSVAFKGIRSGEWGDTRHYLADEEEYNGGADFISTDEHGVIVCQAWGRKEDIPR